MSKHRDTSSTGVLSMLCEGIGMLLLKALLIGIVVGGVLFGIGWAIFH